MLREILGENEGGFIEVGEIYHLRGFVGLVQFEAPAIDFEVVGGIAVMCEPHEGGFPGGSVEVFAPMQCADVCGVGCEFSGSVAEGEGDGSVWELDGNGAENIGGCGP